MFYRILAYHKKVSILTALIVITIVIGIQSVGVILMSALLLAPAAAVDQTPAPTTNNATRDSIVSAAKAAQGTGYVWGGRSYGAWDCSGFVSYIFAQQGIKLTPYTYTMSTELRATANPQPGDIVFTNGYNHVGIYVGNGQMVSALNPSQGTQLTPVDGNGYMPVDGYYTAF